MLPICGNLARRYRDAGACRRRDPSLQRRDCQGWAVDVSTAFELRVHEPQGARFSRRPHPNHALQGTGEWAWGITDWWEMGFYTPYAVDQELTPYSNAAKIRQLFVIPNAAEREFFYGVNFEFSYAMPQFSETRWNMEIRPIVGWRKGDYEFIINPIVDLGFGQNGGAEFVPAARFARNLGENLAVGVEYYTDLGPLQSWLPFNEQQHNIYAVVDFKIGLFDVNAGVGYGLTPGSDRLMAKMRNILFRRSGYEQCRLERSRRKLERREV
jgi:hypothetical protein